MLLLTAKMVNVHEKALCFAWVFETDCEGAKQISCTSVTKSFPMFKSFKNIKEEFLFVLTLGIFLPKCARVF